jgi:hypothetical protein
MENFSQKPPPQPRGRPRLVSQDVEDWAVQCWVSGKTRHTRTNAVHIQDALGQFVNDPRFAWLGSDTTPLRRTILAELGRIEDEAVRELIALDVCAAQPKTREAVARIRAFRLGRSPQGSAAQLYRALLNTLQEYRVAHPDMPWDAVQEAADRLCWWVEDVASDEQGEAENED